MMSASCLLLAGSQWVQQLPAASWTQIRWAHLSLASGCHPSAAICRLLAAGLDCQLDFDFGPFGELLSTIATWLCVITPDEMLHLPPNNDHMHACQGYMHVKHVWVHQIDVS